jgi:hypothetical protein
MHALLLCNGRAGERYDNVDWISGHAENVLSVEADARCLFSTGGQATVMSRRIFLFCGLSRESAAGHLRALKIECRWSFTLFSPVVRPR